MLIAIFSKIKENFSTSKVRFPLGDFFSREQRKKQLDWLATNTDDIISQSNSLFACFPLGDFFSREQAKSECDWLVMSSVFVTSQSSCFFLSSRKQISLVENRFKDD